MKKLSVVIPSRNGREILKKYLPEILRETLAVSGELLVIDDCSSDGTAEFITGMHSSIKLIQRKTEPAFCRAVNLGMCTASGEYLLLLNNDTIPMRNSFGILAGCLQSAGEETAVAVPSIPRPDGTDDSLFRWGRKRGLAVTGQEVRGHTYPSGACALWKREAWEALDGLDCRYAPIYWEDVDMGVRMMKKGYGMVRCPEAVVKHMHASTMGATPETKTLRERNRFIFMETHGVKPGLWLPVHLMAAYLKGNSSFLNGYREYRKWRSSL